MQTVQAELVSRQANDTLSLVQTAQVQSASAATGPWTPCTSGHCRWPAIAADHCRRGRSLGLSESATVVVCKAAFDDLTLADSATYERTTGVEAFWRLRHGQPQRGAGPSAYRCPGDYGHGAGHDAPGDRVTTCRRGTSWRSRTKAAWFRPRARLPITSGCKIGQASPGRGTYPLATRWCRRSTVPDPVQGVDTVLIGLQDLATANLVSASRVPLTTLCPSATRLSAS